jgi:phosphatidylethanolamine-binding protein (PEBP) family uncharacterized protein
MNQKIVLTGFALTLMLSATGYAKESLSLTSPSFEDGGMLPVGFTCNGEGLSPPLNWSGVPADAKSLVVIMDHMPSPKPRPGANERPEPKINDSGSDLAPPPEKPLEPNDPTRPPEGLRWYWTMYNIPATLSGVSMGSQVGTVGTNVVNHQNNYAPPCSKGPGPKSYTIHLYALSERLTLTDSNQVTESSLRAAMEGLVIDSASISASFERGCPAISNQVEHNPADAPKNPDAMPRCEPIHQSSHTSPTAL